MPIIDNTLVIDGCSLTLEEVISFLEDEQIKVLISSRARERVIQSRKKVEQQLDSPDKVVYGLHTGLGHLKDYRIQQHEQELFQRNILYSHACGVGACFDDRIIRLTMLLRANVFCRGNSGVRLTLVQRLVDFINAGVYPQVPQIGSLGVGDLQPMAYLGLSLAGMPEGMSKFQGITGNSPDILYTAGIKPIAFHFAPREALALMSGSTVVLAGAIFSWYRAKRLLDFSDGALALSLEALRGETDAFDERIHSVRNIPGQAESAGNVRRLLNKSGFTLESARLPFGEELPRIQDPVSFRSSPQVHGAARDALSYVESVLSREMNASTDNPLFFENERGELESLSGGNFHAALLGYSMDLLAIVLTDLGVLSERRSARLLDPGMSYGLPCNLVPAAMGLNTGFALIQANATALVGEMRILATPASIGSIPAKNNQEDHNSMAMGAVRKALQVLDHLEVIVAVEYLCAAQGIDIAGQQLPGVSTGTGTGQLHHGIRREIPYMDRDIFTGQVISRMVALLKDRRFAALLTSVPDEPARDLSLIG